MKPLVSIIVPIYNVEPYLKKCIDSIIKQTLTNIEIILVNDGSTDNCGKIIDEYAKKDNRIIALHKENGGQASARNMGLEIARGKYVGFVDSDDWIELDMYEKLYNSVQQTDSDMGVCSRRTYSDKNELQYEGKIKKENIDLKEIGINTYIATRLLKGHTLVVYNKIYKKQIIIDNNLIFDSVKDVGSEDTLFNYKVLQNIEKIAGISDAYYNCLAREGSTARSYDKKYMIRIGNLLEKIKEYSLQMNIEENSNCITPIMLIHFLNRYITRIENYSNNKIVNLFANHIKEFMKVNSIKENMNLILYDNSYIPYINKQGYTIRGVTFIKVFSLLCNLKMYKIASKLITYKSS